MEHIQHWVTDIHPVTRYWVAAILVCSVVTDCELISNSHFRFIPEKAFGGQFWLFLTSFCYFGPISVSLLVNIWLVVNQSGKLEEEFSTPRTLLPREEELVTEVEQVREVEQEEQEQEEQEQEEQEQEAGETEEAEETGETEEIQPPQSQTDERIRQRQIREQHRIQLQQAQDTHLFNNKTYDYIYYVFLITLSIIGSVTLGRNRGLFTMPYLGPILSEVLLYIWCRNNAEVEINFLGILRMKSAYLPWCHVLWDWLTSPNFQLDLYSIFQKNIYIGVIFTSAYFWKSILTLGLGHFWWFVRDFLAIQFYSDANEERRLLRLSGKRQIQRAGFIRRRFNISRFISRILLPPWYW
ncbi:hypothetical protein CAAN1_02S09010 [[Candida] anglica]|uniref:Derlin n=1 Tax=[Candida] anglica TaxID=148631 RepID=A0ABP0EDL5_9ASCO